MNTFDATQEWQRLTDLYDSYADSKLEELASHAYELTETAITVLKGELARRRLDVELVMEFPAEEEEFGPMGDFDATGLDLIPAVTAWDRDEASRLLGILNGAGIATFIGDTNVQELENFDSGFEGGVEIKVRRVDRNWAGRTLYMAHSPTKEDIQEEEDQEKLLERCPKCQTPDIVFVGFDPPPPPGVTRHDSKYMWRCEECGHKWKDDGVAFLA